MITRLNCMCDSPAQVDTSFVQCRRRRLKISVVGVPKTIDNDILLMDKTFGFDTAVEEAQRAINSAYIEVIGHLTVFWNILYDMGFCSRRKTGSLF